MIFHLFSSVKTRPSRQSISIFMTSQYVIVTCVMTALHSSRDQPVEILALTLHVFPLTNKCYKCLKCCICTINVIKKVMSCRVFIHIFFFKVTTYESFTVTAYESFTIYLREKKLCCSHVVIITNWN